MNAGFLGAFVCRICSGICGDRAEEADLQVPAVLNSVRPMIIYPVFGILIGSMVTTLIIPFMGMINDGLTGVLKQHAWHEQGASWDCGRRYAVRGHGRASE